MEGLQSESVDVFIHCGTLLRQVECLSLADRAQRNGENQILPLLESLSCCSGS
jgi:hypothetical protein